MRKLIAGLASTGLIATMLVAGATTASATAAGASASVAANTTVPSQIFAAAKKKKAKNSKANSFTKNINNKVKKKLKIRTAHFRAPDALFPISKKNRYYINNEAQNTLTRTYAYPASNKKKANSYVKEVERSLKQKKFKKYRFSKIYDYKGDRFEFRSWHNKSTMCTVKKPLGKGNNEASFSCVRKSELKKSIKLTKPFATAYDKAAKKKSNKMKRGTVKNPIFISYPEINNSKHKSYKKYKNAVGFTMGAALVFAKAPGKKWTLLFEAQDASCKQIEKTKLGSRAWHGAPCDRNGKVSKVKARH